MIHNSLLTVMIGVSALPFLGVIIGVLCGVGLIAFHSKTRFARRLREDGHVTPEERLIPMIAGGFILPIGLFWFAWTSFPDISPWPQIISGIPLGMGIILIFLQGFNYIIDTYLMYSNSAIAANTFLRSFFGAGFPLIALPM
jgi:DHA1 family multidrug resistance protein-like MFS transporter